MQRIENVMYDEKPDKVVVGPTIVDVCISAVQVEEEDTTNSNNGEKSVKWKCTIDRYTSNEYIAVLHTKNVELEQQMTQAQVGIVEVYEMLLG